MRAKENIKKHYDEIYLFLNKPGKYEKMIPLCVEPIVLKINLNEINDEIKFYFDSRVNNAFYIYEPISYKAIKMEE